MSQNNLKDKAVKGVFWTAIQRYSTMFIQFFSGVILARLLSPSDYGCIGMLTVFTTLAQVFIDSGFDSALIQKKNPTSTDYSTVFYFNLGMSVILYLVLFFSAPYIAEFYNMPIVCKIIRVQALVLIVYSLNLIQRNRLRKNLSFNKIAKITIITSFLSLLITVGLAYSGFGVWSLVTQNFIIAIVPCLYFYFTSDWHPTLEYSWKSFRDLFSFGSYVLFSNLFDTFCNQLSTLLVGRWFNATQLGYYTRAQGTADMASTSISGVVLETTYPLYASFQDDKERLSNIIKQAVTTLAYFSIPLLFVLIALARPIFIIIYSEKWIQCVPYFQIICFAGMASCLMAVNTQPIAAIGKSREMFKWSVFKRTIGIIIMFVLLYEYGMIGLLIGIVVSNWIAYIVNISLVSKYIGYKSYKQILDLLPIFVISSVCALISYICGCLLNTNIYIRFVLQFFVFIMGYGLWSIIFKPQPYLNAKSMLVGLIHKNKYKV